MDKDRENESFVIMAQMQVLRILIDNPDIKVTEINSDSFADPQWKAYYQALQLLKDTNESINESSLFREANKIDDSVNVATSHTLFDIDVDATNLEGALNSLKDAIAKNKIAKTADRIKELATSANPLNSTQISSLEYTIQETLATAYKQVKSKDFNTILDTYEAELEQRKLGLQYPFNDTFLDSNLTKKAAPGQIILIAGATGTGKSIYSLYLMSGMVNTDIPCMYFSPEMDEISTMDRWMAMRTEIPVDQWYSTGSEMDPMIELVQKERDKLKDKAFRFLDEPDISLDQIRHYVREFKMTYHLDYCCIFVDLITQVREFIDTKGQKGISLPTLMEQGINKLNVIAKKENVCIIAIAQMNRDADSAKVKSIADLQALRPTRNNIKNSASLAERSRTVLSIFREKYYADMLLPNDPEIEFIQDILEVQVVKQSMGKNGNIGKYNFNGPTFTINELIEEEE
jgi:replicative DNA helicase